MPSSTKRRVLVRAAIVEAVVFCVIVGVFAFRRANAPTEPRITISKETTYITEPLDADGFPDYVEAVNRRLSEGVTPENNAAVPLFRACGPKEIPRSLRAEFFKRLGIAPLPAEGDYLVEIYEFGESLRRRGMKITDEELYEEWYSAEDGAWTSTQLPEIAELMAANRSTLRIVSRSSLRSRFFLPKLSLSSDISATMTMRGAMRHLLVQGLNHVGDGHLPRAQENSLAMHRLAALMAADSGQIRYLVANAVDAHANVLDRALLQSGSYDARAALSYRDSLQKLGPLPASKGWDFLVRCWLLGGIVSWARHPNSDIKDLEPDASDDLKQAWKAHCDKARLKLIDWNAVLIFANQIVDRAVRIARMRDYAKQIAALEEMEHELKQLHEETGDLGQYITGLSFLQSNKDGATNWFKHAIVGQIPDSLRGGLQAHGRARMRHDVMLVALGLHACRQDRGDYPKTLAALVPKYVPKVPQDLFSGKPIRYSRSEAGCVVYSVGQNGKDDNGRGYNSSPQGDDIGIRLRRR